MNDEAGPSSSLQQPDVAGPSTSAGLAANAPGQGTHSLVPTLQNVVATVNLDTRLDLKSIANKARYAEYNPKVSALHCPPGSTDSH